MFILHRPEGKSLKTDSNVWTHGNLCNFIPEQQKQIQPIYNIKNQTLESDFQNWIWGGEQKGHFPVRKEKSKLFTTVQIENCVNTIDILLYFT